jgi:2-(1,2-epoxy-1,2-dihydrophenyl)acetyl-CoA isomerase
MTLESSGVVRLSLKDGIARITINRPERKNAINLTVHAALRDALDRIETDPGIRVVLLTGAGDSFCSGQDLVERAGMLAEGDIDLAQSLEDNYNPLVRRLVALPMPVIAAVNGVAAGAGAALALTADIVFAARSARFQLGFARVALGPDCGVSWLLPRLIGRARATAMVLCAEMIDAQRAENWGLIWRVTDSDSLPEAQALAENLAAGPQDALRAIKRRMRESFADTLDMALDAERDAQGLLGALPDYRAAVEAFVSKRKAAFR